MKVCMLYCLQQQKTDTIWCHGKNCKIDFLPETGIFDWAIKKEIKCKAEIKMSNVENWLSYNF